MTEQLERMISAQAAVIAGLADPELTVEAASRLAGARRIWLIGTGSSLHAAELGALELAGGGIDARPIASNAFTGGLLRYDDAAIVITHTGQTNCAQRSRALLLAAGVPLVSVTGPDVAWPEAVRTPLAEASETYTVSYTATLTVLAQIAHHLGVQGGGPAAVRATAAVLDEEPPDVPVPARAMAIVGPGLWSVTAREGALKIREGARILCEGFDPDRLLHGGAVPYTAADALLVLQPANPDELTAALCHAAVLERMQVTTLSSSVTTGSALLDQIPMTVKLQRLALRFAWQRGQNADVAITGAWADPSLWPS